VQGDRLRYCTGDFDAVHSGEVHSDVGSVRTWLNINGQWHGTLGVQQVTAVCGTLRCPCAGQRAGCSSLDHAHGSPAVFTVDEDSGHAMALFHRVARSTEQHPLQLGPAGQRPHPTLSGHPREGPIQPVHHPIHREIGAVEVDGQQPHAAGDVKPHPTW
jgi:hypothetical protein